MAVGANAHARVDVARRLYARLVCVCVRVRNLGVFRDLQQKLDRNDSSLSRGCCARCRIKLDLDADRIVRQDGKEVTLLSIRVVARLYFYLNRTIGNYAGCQNRQERRVKDCRIPRGRTKDDPIVGAIR